MSRVITVFAQKGQTTKDYETDAKTWGELKSLVAADFDLSNQAATESVRRSDLAHEDAILPDGDFIIFLRPTKVKAGSLTADQVEEMSYQDLREWAKENDALDFLSNHIDGKNWTQLRANELREGILAFVANSGSSIDDTASGNGDFVTPLLHEAMKNIERAIELLGEVTSNEAVQAKAAEEEAAKAAAEAAAKEKARIEALSKQFNEMKSGFSDACSAKNL